MLSDFELISAYGILYWPWASILEYACVEDLPCFDCILDQAFFDSSFTYSQVCLRNAASKLAQAPFGLTAKAYCIERWWLVASSLHAGSLRSVSQVCL
eukprot:3747397-Pleurochrysis_carterae.AAC.2